ncbi:MAG TPA: hypothetical protein VFZ66_09140 [Herpetosiphonaceae bacterium]
MLKAGTAARRRTYTWEPARPAAEARQQIEALLHTIDRLLQERNSAWVGHVKILIGSGAEAAYGSITTAADQPRWSGTLAAPIRQAELTIYAAIYTLTDAQVAAAVDEALDTADLPF